MTLSLADTFHVQNGKPVWQGMFRTAFSAILQEPKNEGLIFDISVKPVSQDARYWQHKFYRGYLIPAIAAESFDGIEAKAHYELKKMLLFVQVSSWEEIPSKHRDKCTPLLRQTVVDGEVKDELYAYIPSTANLTKKEFEDYIKKVEVLATDLQLSFVDKDGNNVEKQAADAKRRGFGK